MYPNLVLQNQFGEVSNNVVKGGSNQIDINFIVDKANGNGLGIRSLKGSSLISNVFMSTSATPAAGNPNPSTGLILVEFSQAFAGYLGGYNGFVSPLSGTPINVTSALTVGNAYVIVSVGTTTAAEWQSIGLPSNIVPAVGAAFICTSATPTIGTGVIEAIAANGSGIDHIEAVGDVNQSINVASGGGYAILQCFLGNVQTAPANNSVIGLRFVMVAPSNQAVEK